MKNAKQIDFNRDRSNEKRAARRVIAVIVAVFVLGAVVFTAVMAVNDFDFEKFLGAADAPTEETTAEAPETAALAAPFSDADAVNILLLCSEEKRVTFCEILSFSAAENSIRVKPVSPELRLETGNASTRIAELFHNFGAAEVARAIGEKYVPIHRWVSVSEANFKKIVQGFGNVDVYVPNPVDFSVDAIRYQFGKGTHSMNSDALVSVMKLGYEGDDALSFQAAGVAAVLKTCLTPQTLEKGERFFTEFVNQVDGNITAFDYATYAPRLAAFLERSPEISVIS